MGSAVILQDANSTPFGRVRLYIEDCKVWVCREDVSRIMEVAWNPRERKCRSIRSDAYGANDGDATLLTFADVDDITRIAQDAGEPGVASYFVDWVSRKVVPSVRQYAVYVTDTPEEAFRKYIEEREAAMLDADYDWLDWS